MFVPTAANVITADDGDKALVLSLDLIVPLNPDGLAELVGQLLAAPETTEQDNTEEDA